MFDFRLGFSGQLQEAALVLAAAAELFEGGRVRPLTCRTRAHFSSSTPPPRRRTRSPAEELVRGGRRIVPPPQPEGKSFRRRPAPCSPPPPSSLLANPELPSPCSLLFRSPELPSSSGTVRRAQDRGRLGRRVAAGAGAVAAATALLLLAVVFILSRRISRNAACPCFFRPATLCWFLATVPPFLPFRLYKKWHLRHEFLIPFRVW